MSQFVAGFVATGPLKIAKAGTALKALKGGQRVAATLARGAAVDAAVFDPYEAQLAELAAKAPVPLVRELGEKLSVTEDDTPLVARTKRAAAGMIPAVAIDALVAGVRAVKAGKVLRSPTVTKAEQAVAEKALDESVSTLDAIDAQTHVPEGAHFIARNNPDGTSTIIPVSAEAKAATKGEAAPTFQSLAEAQQQTAAMDLGIDARLTAGKADETVVTQAVDALRDFAGTKKLDQLDIFADNALGGASYHTTADEAATLVEKIAPRIKGALDAAIAEHGEVAVEESFRIAREALGMIPEGLGYRVLNSLGAKTEIQSVAEVMSRAHLVSMGRRVANLDQALASRPHDGVLAQEAADAVNNLLDFEAHTQRTTAEAGRRLRMTQERGNALAKELTDAPRPQAAEGLPEAASAPATTRRATAENVRDFTRLYRLTGGEPHNLNAAIEASRVYERTGLVHKAAEVFVNSLLSNPATAKTVVVSGQALSVFEASTRVLAGIGNANLALTREGLDTLWGLYRHVAENLKVARMALNEGRSLINPLPITQAIGGISGRVVRLPGAVLTAGDEFTRATNYRAFVRARSLRQGRALGLDGAALIQHAEADLKAAFDPTTGAATVPEALSYAERSTLAGPLGLDTFGGKFAELVRETPALQFVAPFVRAATNIFRHVWMNTPALNLTNRHAREILRQGGEEAAVLRAKTAIAGMVYLWAYGKAMSGELTGRAPKDPALRDAWLQNHQEYSIRRGDEWVSYRRLDPFASMLGLMADAATLSKEADMRSANDLVSAGVVALAQNIATPGYFENVGDFLNAFDGGDDVSFTKYMQRQTANFIPKLANAFNDDPYVREVQSLTDALANRLPGFSETLDPRYNVFGEPVLNGGIGNRSALLATKSAKESVEDQLATLGKGFTPFSKTIEGQIDLSDRLAFDNGTGVSPWARMMQLVRAPEDGRPSLRAAVEALVKSEKYQAASRGDADFPGGRKWDLVSVLRQRYQTAALKQVMSEYPKLAEERKRVLALERSAYRSEDGKEAVEAIFGKRLQRKR
ncbi:MAG TPA: hypothetical protein VJR92_13780 [Gemmatimonadaceae bacterium]|nr:hypothetical protein [Gemmatimonadaceae bacterium]